MTVVTVMLHVRIEVIVDRPPYTMRLGGSGTLQCPLAGHGLVIGRECTCGIGCVHASNCTCLCPCGVELLMPSRYADVLLHVCLCAHAGVRMWAHIQDTCTWDLTHVVWELLWYEIHPMHCSSKIMLGACIALTRGQTRRMCSLRHAYAKDVGVCGPAKD